MHKAAYRFSNDCKTLRTAFGSNFFSNCLNSYHHERPQIICFSVSAFLVTILFNGFLLIFDRTTLRQKNVTYCSAVISHHLLKNFDNIHHPMNHAPDHQRSYKSLASPQPREPLNLQKRVIIIILAAIFGTKDIAGHKIVNKILQLLIATANHTGP